MTKKLRCILGKHKTGIKICDGHDIYKVCKYCKTKVF